MARLLKYHSFILQDNKSDMLGREELLEGVQVYMIDKKSQKIETVGDQLGETLELSPLPTF